MHKKNNGAYYTPDFLSDFIMDYVSPYFNGHKKMSILEPSVGDGSFVKSFNKTKFPKSIQNFSFQGVEKFLPEIRKAQEHANINRKRNTRFYFEKNDFLKFQATVNRKFSFIAGNPPYIKRSLLNKIQSGYCKQIYSNAKLADRSVNNIWAYFLIRCCQLLEDKGVLAFVLPAELLQVNFSIELRQFLVSNFQRTEIFTFDDLLFECKGQDTILLIAYKQHQETGQFFTHIKDVEQLAKRSFTLALNNSLTVNDTKWTHHSLSSDELSFIYRLGGQLENINQYCDSKPGIVTAANKFFIVDQKTEIEYELTQYVRPIIQKGFFVNGSIVFDNKEFNQLVNEGKPAKILCISDEQAGNLPDSVNSYLEIGVQADLANGYKCSKRKNWFVVPNIAGVPDGFFFRRIHHYPKFLKNDAKVMVTDTAYKIDMHTGYKIDDLIHSFYNSLTLSFAELQGRYYGGGVLELTPQEFKKLPVPYVSLTHNDFNVFRKIFENKSCIDEVLSIYDNHILNTSLGLSDEEVEKVQAIRDKLMLKRFRN